MRSTEHFKRHLEIITRVDCKEIGRQQIEDPFAVTLVVVEYSLWAWVKMLFKVNRSTEIRVDIRADGVAMGRWFRGVDVCEKCKHATIGPVAGVHPTEPGYHHGKERWCESCYYDYSKPESRPIGTGNCEAAAHK